MEIFFVFDSIAIVGATGAVGQLIRNMLEERDFPYEKITFLASARSAGSKIKFKGEEHTVEELKPDAFEGIDLAIGSTPDPVAKDFVPWAKAAAASSSTRAATGGWTQACRWSFRK